MSRDSSNRVAFLSNAWRATRYGVRLTRFALQTYPMLAYLRFVKTNPIVRGKVTIVTATYNRPDRLRQAIEYVQAQTYDNWEQIIISDGRDDRVPKLVADVGDPRIRSSYTYRFPVVGQYQKNYALRFASGEYILYFDDDNIIYPHCLETMVRGFASDDIGYVVCPIKYSDRRRGDDDVMVIKHPKPGFKYREIDQLNYMIRRRLIERVWGLRMYGDGDFRLINSVAQISQGTYFDEVIGHHL